MDHTYLLHMLRTRAIDAGVLIFVSIALTMLLCMPLIFALAKREKGRLNSILAGTVFLVMMVLPIGFIYYVNERYVFGDLQSIFLDEDNERVFFVYRLIKYYEGSEDETFYRLHQRALRGPNRSITEITRYEDRGRPEFWYHRFEDKLLIFEDKKVRVMSLKDGAVAVDHATLAKRQPALAGAIKLKGASADGASLWFEDAGALSYRLDMRTLEAQRERPPSQTSPVSSESQQRDGLGWMPSRSVGCEDKQRLSTEPVKDAPRRATVRFGQKTTPGDGWLTLAFLRDPTRDCALQPSAEGGVIALAHDALDAPQLLIVGIDPQGQQRWSLDTGWSANRQLALIQRRDDGAILLVNLDGAAALLDPAAGKLRWSIPAAEQARWWGEGRALELHHVSVDKDALTLWIVEDKVTPHLVRRALKDGALISSRGF